MLISTLNAERERIEGLEAAAQRARFACLAHCDFAGARAAWNHIKRLRAQKALIAGELFTEKDET